MQNLVEGYNTSVMLYGVTGSGKTHTVFGSLGIQTSKEKGVIYHATQDLFKHHQTSLHLSYIEIYNEKVKDLLSPTNAGNLMILQNSDGGVQVPGLSQIELKDFEELIEYVRIGNRRRKMAKTNSNSFSSRSHAIIQITLRRKIGEDKSPSKIQDEKYNAYFGIENPNNKTENYVESKLSFIDLAGSERVCVSQARGIRMTEGSNINKSLLALGNVINKLSDKRKGIYVPYRDSKLTRLLKDSLGGNTRTVLIACITPNSSQIDETIHSLNYALRAKKIKTRVKKNQFRKGGRKLSEFGNKGQDSFDSNPFLQEILVLRKEVVNLKQELEKERGGRSTIEKVYEELVLGIEEEFELKSSINELEQLQDSNISKLQKLENKKDDFKLKGDYYGLKMLERDIRELEQIIDENEDLKMNMISRIKVMERERRDWVSKGVKNFSRFEKSKSPNIHKSSRGLSKGRRTIVSGKKETRNQAPLPLKNSMIKSNILSRKKKRVKRETIVPKKIEFTPEKHEKTYFCTLPDSCERLSRRSVQSKFDLSSRIERQNSLLNEIDMNSVNGQKVNERKTEKKNYSKNSSIRKNSEKVDGFSIKNEKKGAKLENELTKNTSSLREELTKLSTVIQDQRQSSHKKSIKYFARKSSIIKGNNEITPTRTNISLKNNSRINIDQNNINIDSTRKILDFEDRKLSKISNSLLFKDEYKSSNLYEISPPSEINSKAVNEYLKIKPTVEPIKLGINDLTTSSHDMYARKNNLPEKILSEDINKEECFKDKNILDFKTENQERSNNDNQFPIEDSMIKNNINFATSSCFNVNCSEINPPTENEQSSFFTAQLASTKLLCDIPSEENSINEVESVKKLNEGKNSCFIGGKVKKLEISRRMKNVNNHEIENFSSHKEPRERMNDSLDFQLNSLQDLDPQKSDRKGTIQEKLTRARKRMRQFKKKLSLMKGFMDKYEKRALKKGTMEIYRAVMILVEENKKHGYNLLMEEKNMLERMKKFGESFQEIWGISDESDTKSGN